MVVGGEERQGRAQGGPRLAVPGAGQEHRRHGAARQRLAPVARRDRRVSAPSPTRTPEQSTTIPSAAAAGGMAAFSAGVRLMGAGSQRVSATSARPATPETPTYTRAAVRLPPATRLRVAASASAG